LPLARQPRPAVNIPTFYKDKDIMRRLLFLSFMFLVVWNGSAQEVLELANGDRIQGRLEKKEAGLIHFRSPVLGLLKLPEAKVKQIHPTAPPAEKPAAAAKPAQPTTQPTTAAKPAAPKPPVQSAAKPTAPKAETPAQPAQTAAPATATAAKPKAPEPAIEKPAAKPVPTARPAPAPKKAPPAPAKKPKKWSGDIGVSYNKRKAEYERRSGNTIRRRTDDIESFRGNFRVQWKSTPHELEWRGSYVYATNEELRYKKSSDNYSLSQQYRFALSPRFFLQTKSSYESDFLRDVDDDFWQSAGLGWHLLKNDRFSLTVVPGAAWHYLDQKEEPIQREFVPALDQNAEWKITKDFSLFEEFNHLGDFNRYKYKLSAGLDNRLIKNFFIRFEYRYEFDTFVEKNSEPFMQRQVITSLRYRF